MIIDICPLCGDFDIGDWCNHCQVPTIQKDTNPSRDNYPEEDPGGKQYEDYINSMVIELPDGYNGNTLLFSREPLEEDGNLVKLQCVEKGKEYMFRWVRKQDLK